MKINLHTHNEFKQVYLNNKNQYLAFLHKKKIDLNKHKEKLNCQIQNIGSQLKELINQIYILQDLLPSLEIQQSQQQLQQIEQMINYVNQDFYLISNEQIKQTEKINNKEIVFVLQEWREFDQNLQIMINKFEKLNNQPKKNDKQINLNQFKYKEDPQNKIQNQQTQHQSQNGIRFINVEQINRKQEQVIENQMNRGQIVKISEGPLATSDIRYFHEIKSDQQFINYQKEDTKPYAQSQVQKIQQDQQLTQILSKHTAEQKRQSESREIYPYYLQTRDKSNSMGLQTIGQQGLTNQCSQQTKKQ